MAHDSSLTSSLHLLRRFISITPNLNQHLARILPGEQICQALRRGLKSALDNGLRPLQCPVLQPLHQLGASRRSVFEVVEDVEAVDGGGFGGDGEEALEAC